MPGPSANGGHLGGGHCSPLPLPLSQARPRLAGRPLLWAGQSRAVPPGCSSAPPSSVCQQHQRGTRLRRLQQHPPTLVLAPVMHVLDSLGCQAQGPSGPRAFPIPLASSPAPSSTRSSSPDAASAEPESRGMTARSPRGASRLASAAGGSLERGSGSGGDPRRGVAEQRPRRRRAPERARLQRPACEFRRWPWQPRRAPRRVWYSAGSACSRRPAVPETRRCTAGPPCAVPEAPEQLPAPAAVCLSHHLPMCAGCSRREASPQARVCGVTLIRVRCWAGAAGGGRPARQRLPAAGRRGGPD